MKLYEAVLSSAAFRVRIALNLKGLAYESEVFDLRAKQQLTDEYRRLNPLQAVPTLVDGAPLIESMAIVEYLEETHPEPPLLPRPPLERARVRAMAQLVACDIHPLNNLRVLRYLSHELHADDAARDHWYHHWIEQGFSALEQLLPAEGAIHQRAGAVDDVVDGAAEGAYCHGPSPTVADVFLVPQVANALRFEVDLAPYARIRRIYEACMRLPAFDRAHPKNHPATAK